MLCVCACPPPPTLLSLLTSKRTSDVGPRSASVDELAGVVYQKTSGKAVFFDFSKAWHCLLAINQSGDLLGPVIENRSCLLQIRYKRESRGNRENALFQICKTV